MSPYGLRPTINGPEEEAIRPSNLEEEKCYGKLNSSHCAVQELEITPVHCETVVARCHLVPTLLSEKGDLNGNTAAAAAAANVYDFPHVSAHSVVYHYADERIMYPSC